MGRRRNGKGGEQLIKLLARLPWWLCFVLAVVSYLALHAWASMPPPKPELGPQGIVKGTSMVATMVFAAVQMVGQYAVPLMFVAAGALSAVGRMQRRKLVEDSKQAQDAAAIDGMSWQRFEMLVGEGFRQRGFTVEETGGGGADGGVDVVLRKPGTNGAETFFVQCKQWRAYKVSVNVVRELYGVMAAKGAAGGFVVTSGRFTREAHAFADGRNITLIDGEKLQDLLALGSRSTSGPVPQRQEPAFEDVTMVVCPLCSHPMIKRVAKRGPNVGEAFYGCVNYPGCKGTRPI
ncbi:restriction endonuclease [Roseateles chitosanitabidus]|uniref:restriction endonuclease n=1 Tax=Roseateles chitosanitabidus TaxID=65048 RepID=UPI00082A3E1F|nr:restriction endonuclease [Roseateles chitosanitabidus]